MKFNCKNCGYSFEKNFKPKKCPFCGEEKLERQKTAEEILEDIKNG